MRDLVLCYARRIEKDELVYDWIIEDAMAVIGDRAVPALDIAETVAPQPPPEDSDEIWQTSDGIQYRFAEPVTIVKIELTNPNGPLGCYMEDITAEYLFREDWPKLARIGEQEITKLRQPRSSLFATVGGEVNTLTANTLREVRFWALYHVSIYRTWEGEEDFRKELLGPLNLDCISVKDAVTCKTV